MIYLLFVICHFLFAAPVFADIAATKHNLSVTGPGTFKAASQTEICVFCHVPHGANPAVPLWNHLATIATFTPYNQSISQTLKSNPGQPNGASKLCLGCHDGTIALGSTGSSGTIAGLEGMISGRSLLGTNLANSHPVSFVYNAALVALNNELVNPAILTDRVKLDSSSQVQCTSCHDPHDNSNGNFLVAANTGGSLCVVCHRKSGWDTAIHQSATGPAGRCNSCHTPHGAAAVPLLNQASPNLCYTCHGAGGPAPTDIQYKFSGTATYTLGLYGTSSYLTATSHHDVSASDRAFSGSRLTCGSCHNSHAVKRRSGTGPTIDSLVDPFNRSNTWTGDGATTYRQSTINFCLKCHSGTFPPSVADPSITIAPSTPIINIGAAYLTDVHGSGSVRPTPSNPAPAVSAMACTVCHDEHGSHFTDSTFDGNVYNIRDIVDGTSFSDNGAESAGNSWPYVAPTSATGIIKTVRINPLRISSRGDPNNLYSLCGACHSKISGTSAPHSEVLDMCVDCHSHGRSHSAYGGL